MTSPNISVTSHFGDVTGDQVTEVDTVRFSVPFSAASSVGCEAGVDKFAMRAMRACVAAGEENDTGRACQMGIRGWM